LSNLAHGTAYSLTLHLNHKLTTRYSPFLVADYMLLNILTNICGNNFLGELCIEDKLLKGVCILQTTSKVLSRSRDKILHEANYLSYTMAPYRS